MTKTMEPAARVRNTTLTGSEVKLCPTAVPMKVGPPPIAATPSRNPQLGRLATPSMSLSAASGATMPKPSVALCRAKPMTSTVAKAISLLAAACPIANPSAKLCSPIPMAISKESCLAGDQRASPRAPVVRSVAAIAPGPPRAARAR